MNQLLVTLMILKNSFCKSGDFDVGSPGFEKLVSLGCAAGAKKFGFGSLGAKS